MQSSPSDSSAPSQPSSLAGVAPPGEGEQKLWIEQMFQQIMAQADKTKKSVDKLNREQNEVKRIASKAYSTVSVVQTDLAALTARMDALEKQPKTSSASASSKSSHPRSVSRDAPYSSGSRWEGLGGQQGSLMIFGGFPSWSKAEAIEKTLDEHVFAQLSPDVRQ